MSSESRYAKNIHLLKYMYFKYTNKKFYRESLNKAPPRECLKIFGGPLEIEEFRNKSTRCEILNTPMCYIPGLMERTRRVVNEVKSKNTSLLSDFIKKI
jgi:hypothetical protein